MEKGLSRNYILELLRGAGGNFVSGEELSRALNLSRAAVWKQVSLLRRQGYDIDARPRFGYRLLAVPDRLSSEEIRGHLSTRWMGKAISSFDEVDSTNRIAKELARKGAPHGTVVVAESQTGGRGRLGRTWIAPSGKGAWFSVILRPRVNSARLPQIPLLAAVAVQDAIREVTGLSVGIKWPNDLISRGRKLCGILTEVKGELDAIDYVILGIGLNINLNETDFPLELRPKATSLLLELGRPIVRVPLFTRILAKLEEWHEIWQDEGFAPIREAWKEANVTLGSQVRLTFFDEEVVGYAVGLDDDGFLLLKGEDGEIRRFISGEIPL